MRRCLLIALCLVLLVPGALPGALAAEARGFERAAGTPAPETGTPRGFQRLTELTEDPASAEPRGLQRLTSPAAAPGTGRGFERRLGVTAAPDSTPEPTPEVTPEVTPTPTPEATPRPTAEPWPYPTALPGAAALEVAELTPELLVELCALSGFPTHLPAAARYFSALGFEPINRDLNWPLDYPGFSMQAQLNGQGVLLDYEEIEKGLMRLQVAFLQNGVPYDGLYEALVLCHGEPGAIERAAQSTAKWDIGNGTLGVNIRETLPEGYPLNDLFISWVYDAAYAQKPYVPGASGDARQIAAQAARGEQVYRPVPFTLRSGSAFGMSAQELADLEYPLESYIYPRDDGKGLTLAYEDIQVQGLPATLTYLFAGDGDQDMDVIRYTFAQDAASPEAQRRHLDQLLSALTAKYGHPFLDLRETLETYFWYLPQVSIYLDLQVEGDGMVYVYLSYEVPGR